MQSLALTTTALAATMAAPAAGVSSAAFRVTNTTDSGAGSLRQAILDANGTAVTGGCGNGSDCPLADNTRGQMAVFIAKAFYLQ